MLLALHKQKLPDQPVLCTMLLWCINQQCCRLQISYYLPSYLPLDQIYVSKAAPTATSLVEGDTTDDGEQCCSVHSHLVLMQRRFLLTFGLVATCISLPCNQ